MTKLGVEVDDSHSPTSGLVYYRDQKQRKSQLGKALHRTKLYIYKSLYVSRCLQHLQPVVEHSTRDWKG